MKPEDVILMIDKTSDEIKEQYEVLEDQAKRAAKKGEYNNYISQFG